MAHFKRSLYAVPTATLAIVLGLSGAPSFAFGATSAELQQQLDSAQEKLNKLYSAAEQADNELVTVKNDLAKTQQDIKDTKAQIKDTKAQLASLQGELGDITNEQYKGGGVNLLSLVLTSSDFSNLVSNIHYANKVASYQESVINKSKELQQTLESKQASLEKDEAKQKQLVSEQQAKSDAADKAAADAQSYYDGLSAELKAKIAEEEAAAREKARQEAEAKAAAAAAQQQAAQGGSGNQGTTAVTPSDTPSSTPDANGETPTPAPTPSTPSSGGNGGNGGGYTSSAAALVARAQSIIGSGYSYSGYRWTGDPSTSVFTCSGVVDYALGLGSQSNSPETLYNQVNITTDISQLKYGDLVFFTTSRWCGHVGIYIGNGEMIDSIPGAGVGYRTLDYIGGFIGGGSIV